MLEQIRKEKESVFRLIPSNLGASGRIRTVDLRIRSLEGSQVISAS
jgi:hypothetical protein